MPGCIAWLILSSRTKRRPVCLGHKSKKVPQAAVTRAFFFGDRSYALQVARGVSTSVIALNLGLVAPCVNCVRHCFGSEYGQCPSNDGCITRSLVSGADFAPGSLTTQRAVLNARGRKGKTTSNDLTLLGPRRNLHDLGV
jgi:hypothetical protein